MEQITITHAHINALQSERGGYSNAVIKFVSGSIEKGWKRRAIGRKVDRQKYLELLQNPNPRRKAKKISQHTQSKLELQKRNKEMFVEVLEKYGLEWVDEKTWQLIYSLPCGSLIKIWVQSEYYVCEAFNAGRGVKMLDRVLRNYFETMDFEDKLPNWTN